MLENNKLKVYERRPTRRQFLKRAAASAFFAALHPFGVQAVPKVTSATRTIDGQAPRILALQLHTALPLKDMRAFYNGVLGLPVLSEDASSLTIAGGRTRLTFCQVESEHGQPWYHVAFNIPENKVRSARKWQVARTPLDPNPTAPRDPNYPPDVVYFRHWHAHSVFFRDPAGNLLEYIGRHDLKNAAIGPFASEDILYASEIALVVEDVPCGAEQIRTALGLDRYRNHSRRFEAIGDEHGLLLVMKRGVSLRGTANVFPTVAEIRGPKSEGYSFADFPYEIAVR